MWFVFLSRKRAPCIIKSSISDTDKFYGFSNLSNAHKLFLVACQKNTQCFIEGVLPREQSFGKPSCFKIWRKCSWSRRHTYPCNHQENKRIKKRFKGNCSIFRTSYHIQWKAKVPYRYCT